MEIERKFLIKDLHSLPFSIEAYPHRELGAGLSLYRTGRADS